MKSAVVTIAAGLVSLGVSASLIPFVIRAAARFGFVDVPDGDRRIHSSPVPRLGGVAIAGGALVGLIVLAQFRFSVQLSPLSREAFAALAIACAMMIVVGLRDDLRGVKPGLKLAAQCVAAVLIVASGTYVERIGVLPGIGFNLGVLGIPLTVLWVIVVANAYNLIDGIDGLAAGTGLSALFISAASCVVLGRFELLPVIGVVSGAMLGFYFFNRHPARIFMGDAGSLTLGMALAVIAPAAATDRGGQVHVLVPLCALGFPLLDTGVAIVRRWLRGDSFSRADGRHIHHQLIALGLSQPRTTTVLAGFSLTLGALSLVLSYTNPAVIGVLSGAAFVSVPLLLFYGISLLNYHEFFEAQASIASGMRKARRVIRERIRARDLATEIMRVRSFAKLVEALSSRARVFGFEEMYLAPARGRLAFDVPEAPEWTISDDTVSCWRIQYVVGGITEDNVGPFVLEIRCCDRDGATPVSAERVARILAPAIESRLSSLRHTAEEALV